MDRNQLPVKPLLLFLVVAIVLLVYLVSPKRSDTVIRLHDDQVEIQKLNNAIAEFIITEGYEYKVELVESTIKELHDHLINGGIDITLELWKENNLTWYSEAIANKLISDLGMIYSGGKQYWIVSKWYAEEKGIQTVFEMKDHWRDFVDPDDPSKGLFFNCIFGWICLDINRVKLQAYGLDKYYNTVSPVSPESLKAIYVNAQERRVPVFGYYWVPNSIMTGHDWFALREPPYSMVVWDKVLKAAIEPDGKRLDEASAYKDTGVYKVVHTNLIKKAPDVFGMLKKMSIDIELLNQIMLSDSGHTGSGNTARRQAVYFLTQYPEKWESWVPHKVRKKIIKALPSVTQEADKR